MPAEEDMKKSSLFLFSILGIALLSGCSKKSTKQDRLKEVVVYTYDSFTSEWGCGNTIKDGFEQKTGLKITYVDCGDGVQVLSKAILEKKNVTFMDFALFNDDVIFNAVSILGLEKKYRAYQDICSIHSIIDINIELEVFAKYVKYSQIKAAYKQVERSIMEGVLNNDKESIEEYLRNIKL